MPLKVGGLDTPEDMMRDPSYMKHVQERLDQYVSMVNYEEYRKEACRKYHELKNKLLASTGRADDLTASILGDEVISQIKNNKIAQLGGELSRAQEAARQAQQVAQQAQQAVREARAGENLVHRSELEEAQNKLDETKNKLGRARQQARNAREKARLVEDLHEQCDDLNDYALQLGEKDPAAALPLMRQVQEVRRLIRDKKHVQAQEMLNKIRMSLGSRSSE